MVGACCFICPSPNPKIAINSFLTAHCSLLLLLHISQQKHQEHSGDAAADNNTLYIQSSTPKSFTPPTISTRTSVVCRLFSFYVFSPAMSSAARSTSNTSRRLVLSSSLV